MLAMASCGDWPHPLQLFYCYCHLYFHSLQTMVSTQDFFIQQLYSAEQVSLGLSTNRYNYKID